MAIPGSISGSAATLPRHISVLAVAYLLASIAHFAHNAEYIAFYPGMPAWLTRETVYLAWLGVTSIGLVALVLLRFAAYTAAVALLGVYGALGLDGLAHYTLALCSEHTVVANLTIWSEAITGLLLLVASSLAVVQQVGAAPLHA
jgi:hypothetical protein